MTTTKKPVAAGRTGAEVDAAPAADAQSSRRTIPCNARGRRTASRVERGARAVRQGRRHRGGVALDIPAAESRTDHPDQGPDHNDGADQDRHLAAPPRVRDLPDIWVFRHGGNLARRRRAPRCPLCVHFSTARRANGNFFVGGVRQTSREGGVRLAWHLHDGTSCNARRNRREGSTTTNITLERVREGSTTTNITLPAPSRPLGNAGVPARWAFCSCCWSSRLAVMVKACRPPPGDRRRPFRQALPRASLSRRWEVCGSTLAATGGTDCPPISEPR